MSMNDDNDLAFAGKNTVDFLICLVGVDKRNICSRRKRIQADLRTSQGELFMKLRPIFFSNCHFCVACHCKHLHFDSQSFIA